MKKIISITSGIILLLSIIAFSFIFITRKTFTYNKIYETVKKEIHKQESYSNTYYIEMIIGNKDAAVLYTYFDNNKIEELYLDYYTKGILYERGILEEKPSFDEIQNYIQERMRKFNSETIDTMYSDKEHINKFFFDLNNSTNLFYIPEKTNKLLKIAFNQKLQDLMALLITVSLILMIMFVRDINSILMYLSAIFITSGIGNFIVSRIIRNKEVNDIMFTILNKLSKSFMLTSILLIILGLLCILAIILIKKFYHPVVRQDIERELEEEVYQSFLEKQQKQYFNNNIR